VHYKYPSFVTYLGNDGQTDYYGIEESNFINRIDYVYLSFEDLIGIHYFNYAHHRTLITVIPMIHKACTSFCAVMGDYINVNDSNADEYRLTLSQQALS